jgi:hypothetical protein
MFCLPQPPFSNDPVMLPTRTQHCANPPAHGDQHGTVVVGKIGDKLHDQFRRAPSMDRRTRLDPRQPIDPARPIALFRVQGHSEGVR